MNSRNLRKPRKKPVTLIVGIICKDGIVVAGDSQSTWGTGKSWSTNKLTELNHARGRALVAESGAVISSSKVVEYLQAFASSDNESTLPELTSKAVKKLRDELRHQQFDCTSEEFQTFIVKEELDCALMIAHYQDGPKIDTIQLGIGISNRAKRFFETIGSGSDLAEYLLTELCIPEMDYKTASVIAVHVIEIAKRHDPYCGGPTKLGVLHLPVQPPILPHELAGGFINMPRIYYAPPIILSQNDTDEIVKMVSEVETSTRMKRAELVRDALKKHSQDRRMSSLDPTELDF